MTKIKWLLVGIVATLTFGCGASYRVLVEFSSAPGLKENLDVRLGEQSIGRTGAIEVDKNKVACEVFLNTADAVPTETVFLIVKPTPGQPLLVAYPRSVPMVIQRGASSPQFRGSANRIDLAKIIGKNELGKAVKFIDDVLDIVVGNLSR